MNPDILSQIREGGILYILLLIAVTMHDLGTHFSPISLAIRFHACKTG